METTLTTENAPAQADPIQSMELDNARSNAQKKGEGKGKGRKSANATRFLDLEATVDEEDNEEDNDAEDLNDFLVFEDEQDEQTLFGRRFLHAALDTLHLREENLAPYIDEETLPSVEGADTQELPLEDSDGGDGRLVPSRKLWLVRCRPHKELRIMGDILRGCIKEKETSITTLHCRSEGDGFLFLDTPDPMKAAKILSFHPLIRRSKGNPFYGLDVKLLEDPLESARSLILPPSHRFIERGSWVSLTRPVFYGNRRLAFPGDLALVTAVLPTDGDLQILFATRPMKLLVKMGVPSTPDDSSPILLAGKMLPEGGIATLLAGGLRIDHGLLVGTATCKSISKTTGPHNWHDIRHFVFSQHPLVAEYFPRIDDMEFLLGEVVESWDGKKKGKVSAVTNDGVAISSDVIASNSGDSGRELLGWNVYKCWQPGDYVRSVLLGLDGLTIGMKSNHVFAWVGDLDNHVGTFMEHRNFLRAVPTVERIEALLARRSEDATVEALKHSNISKDALKQAIVQHQKTRLEVDESLALSRTFSCPWKWWTVCVWRGIHKGEHQLMDVTFSTKSTSGLLIQARSNVANASGAPFVVDYNDVVDARLFLPLHLVEPPPKAFRPPCRYLHPAIPCLEQLRATVVLSNQSNPANRGPTPPPPAASSSTEDVWDPDADVQQPLVRTGPGFDWWRSHHTSQHDFYNLLPELTDNLSFQVTLTGIIPDLNGKKYDGSKLFDIFFSRHGNSDHRWLTVKWQQLKGRIPPDMIVAPARPTKKIKLPMVVFRGEHEGSVVTKVTAIGEDFWVLPMDPLLGDVHENWETMRITPHDCCVVWLLSKDAQEKWSKFNPKTRRDGV